MLPRRIPTLEEVQLIETKGPWKTKSDAYLRVPFAMPIDEVMSSYLSYDDDEFKEVPDIRGLRIYTVTDIAKGRIGGNEWHRIRNEFVAVLSGAVRWTCEDLHGNGNILYLEANQYGILMPPFIMHEYEALEDNTSLLVLANTLLDPKDPATLDTYPHEEFEELRKQL